MLFLATTAAPAVALALQAHWRMSTATDDLRVARRACATVLRTVTDVSGPTCGVVAMPSAYIAGADPAFLKTWAEIRGFLGLSDGWKGPGSKAPSLRTIADGEMFTRATVTRASQLATFIGMAADGELVMTWQYPGLLVDVSISGDGTYSLFADFDGREIMNEATPVASGLPVDVLDAIAAKHGGALAG